MIYRKLRFTRITNEFTLSYKWRSNIHVFMYINLCRGFILILYFDITLNLQKNCKSHSKNAYMPFTEISQFLIFWHICFVFLSAAAKSLQSCLTLCDPIDGSPPGSPVPGILQARTLKWVAITFSNAWKWKVKVKLLSPVRPSATPWDCSLPGSSIHRIFQARVLEWGATAFSVSLYIQIFLKFW